MWLVVDSEGYGLRFVQLDENTPPPLAPGEAAYYTLFPYNVSQWRELIAVERSGVTLGTGDGERVYFDLPTAPVVDVTVYVDTVPITTGVVIEPENGAVVFDTPPGSGTVITATYVELANRPVAYMTADKHKINANGTDTATVTFVIEDTHGIGIPSDLEVSVMGTSRKISLTNGVGTQTFASSVPIVFDVEVLDKRVTPEPDRITVEAV